ncbi:MAG: ABC transporter permease [Rhodocyclales bacterium RIFCSPLOWO2_02_FULL_63_24]|nr:MAG: ABC transporter permease [Rhodocyclales bacterium RIFCSPLOWO2_02_FULL_63_24]
MKFKTLALAGLAATAVTLTAPVSAQELKIALIAGKTGFLEAYAKETETGFMMGLEYLTGGKMEINGRKIKVIVKDDQNKPDVAKAALAEAYADDKVDLAVGTTFSAAALAMLPVAEEYKKVLIVEPAVADDITGSKWNRYVFRTGRSSSQDAIAGAYTLQGDVTIATLAQDYAFGRDGIKAYKDALAKANPKAKIVHEEYVAPATTDFTAATQRLFDSLKDKPGRKVLVMIWAGAHPMTKIADLKPERYGIELAPGGNILPVMKNWKGFTGVEGSIYYYYAFPKNKINDWFVGEHQKRFKSPPDFFTAGGFAAASAVVSALTKAGSSDTEKLIAAMEGMGFDTPKGKMIFRKDDHQAMQSMFHFRIKKAQANDFDLLELVREIQASDLSVPIKNKR